MKYHYIGWAIDTCSSEGHGYIGRYWFHRQLPWSIEGHSIALFKTRDAARAGLPGVRDAYPKARVKKVKITVEEA